MNYFNEKTVPRTVHRDRLVDVRAVLDSIRQVPVNETRRAEIIAHTDIKEVPTTT